MSDVDYILQHDTDCGRAPYSALNIFSFAETEFIERILPWRRNTFQGKRCGDILRADTRREHFEYSHHDWRDFFVYERSVFVIVCFDITVSDFCAVIFPCKRIGLFNSS